MQNETPVRLTRWLWPLLVAATVFVASNCSTVAGPDITNIDKLEHGLVFGLLATLVCRAGPSQKWVWLAVLIVSAYGACDEWHQYYTPGRSCDFYDWLADTTGAALAVVLYVRWTWYRRLLEMPLFSRCRVENSPPPAPNISV